HVALAVALMAGTAGGLVRITVTTQVGHHHGMAPRQFARHLVPHGRSLREPMQEQQRRAFATGLIGNADRAARLVAYRDDVFPETGEQGFCLHERSCATRIAYLYTSIPICQQRRTMEEDMADFHCDVAVIGGGVTGVAAGIAAAR